MNKNKIIKFIKKNLPFFIVFIIVFLVTRKIQISNDDLFFKEQLRDENIFSYIVRRYMNWSSRGLIEILLIYVSKLNIIVWKIFNAAFVSIICVAISEIFNKDKKALINWIISLLVLIYPLSDMNSAGPIATTANYLWPLMFFLLSMIPIKKFVIDNEKIKWYELIICIPSILFSVNVEQTCCLSFGFSFVALLYLIKNKKINKKSWYTLLVLFCSIVSLIIIKLSPGNSSRFIQEIGTWYPEYSNYGILKKLYLGIVPTFAILIQNKIIITLLSFYLMIAILKLVIYTYNMPIKRFFITIFSKGYIFI